MLNRTTGPQVLRLFDICFKMGVIDACGINDNEEVRRFSSSMSDSWLFGVVGDSKPTDWRDYRFTLYKWCRGAGLTTFAENYIMMIRKENVYWCLLPYCMRFYILGVNEWLEYPNPAGIGIFKSSPKSHWDKNNKVSKFTKMDYISHMHDFAREYREIPEDLRPVSDASMDSFCSAIYDLTRKYGKKSF